MANILIIDDEQNIRDILADIIKDEGHQTFVAQNGHEALTLLKKELIDLIILDIWLPGIGGIDLLEQIKEAYPLIEIVMISGHATINTAVKSIKLGAFDFIEKPIDMDKLLTVLQNALKLILLRQENLQLKSQLKKNLNLIGSSNQLNQAKKMALNVAKTTSSCLITGENGVGKELIAQLIHFNSARKDKPFIEVNCAAIPDTLIESELFGYEKGAFTGANQLHIGKFEQSHGGTLFLDEIGDLSLAAQAKVLRAIEDQRFTRLGGNKEILINTRFLAATNKNLAKAIDEQTFRTDLFFRLNTIIIELSPLRERTDDIEELLYFFINRYSPTILRTFTADALLFLKTYTWPGNIRELKNFCERLTVLTDDSLISKEMAVAFLQNTIALDNSPDELINASALIKQWQSSPLNKAKENFEFFLIEEALKQNDYNISYTAEQLGVYPSNLHTKIKKLGIEVKK